MTHPNHQDKKARLRIIRTCQAILESAPSPQLTAYIQTELAKATDPQFRGFLNLLITDNTANREMALQAFRKIERTIQEAEAREELSPPVATSAQPVVSNHLEINADSPAPPANAAPGSRPSAAIIDLTAAESTTRSAFQPVHFPSEDELAEEMLIPATEDPNGPRKTYTIITTETPAELLNTQRPTSIAGLLIGIKGQKKIRHGFGIYLPILSGQIKLTDQPTRIRIAVGLPEAILLYDDHAGPHMGGVSEYFAAVESMKNGYRFLLDLEIIPVNGRYLMSMKPHPFVDRRDSQGQPAMIGSIHLPKLHYAAESLEFTGFIGEVEVS